MYETAAEFKVQAKIKIPLVKKALDSNSDFNLICPDIYTSFTLKLCRRQPKQSILLPLHSLFP